MVNKHIEENADYYTPYEYSDHDRLDNSSYFTSKITTQEVYNVIKKKTKKNNTPGLSKINTIIVLNLRERKLSKYSPIY